MYYVLEIESAFLAGGRGEGDNVIGPFGIELTFMIDRLTSGKVPLQVDVLGLNAAGFIASLYNDRLVIGRAGPAGRSNERSRSPAG